MDNCEKCTNEQRLVSLEQNQEKNSEQHKEFYCQLKEIAVSDGRKEERENARDRSIATIMQMVGELKAIITDLQNRPIRQADKVWDKIVDKIVTFAFIAIAGYVLYVVR